MARSSPTELGQSSGGSCTIHRQSALAQLAIALLEVHGELEGTLGDLPGGAEEDLVDEQLVVDWGERHT